MKETESESHIQLLKALNFCFLFLFLSLTPTVEDLDGLNTNVSAVFVPVRSEDRQQEVYKCCRQCTVAFKFELKDQIEPGEQVSLIQMLVHGALMWLQKTVTIMDV